MNLASTVPVLTLDGPSGTGKGTVGQLVASQLGWHYLDSGAIYRVFAVMAERANIQPSDLIGLETFSNTLVIKFESRSNSIAVYCNDIDLSEIIRTESTGDLASLYASVPVVRKSVLNLQKQQRRTPGLVADGRDMGTTVFPDAKYKFFLNASAEVRAERRYKQLKVKGFDGSLSALRDEMRLRDDRDANRKTAPMVMADDAKEIDTSDLNIEEVVNRIINIVRNPTD